MQPNSNEPNLGAQPPVGGDMNAPAQTPGVTPPTTPPAGPMAPPEFKPPTTTTPPVESFTPAQPVQPAPSEPTMSAVPPAPADNQPSQPFQPSADVADSMTTPAPAPTANSGLKIALIIGGGVLVLIALGFAAYFVFNQ